MSRPILIVLCVLVALSAVKLWMLFDAGKQAAAPAARVLGIDVRHRACQVDADCVIVAVDCSACDCGVAVHRDRADHYRAGYRDLCLDYSGPVCEVYCPDTVPRCRSGLCVTGQPDGQP